MMTLRSFSRVIALLSLSLATSAWIGCSSTPDADEGSGSDTGSEFREAPSTGGMDEQSKLSGFQTVYFDYDSSEIRSDARTALASNADRLNSMSGSVTIEGHCDERGSTEYNLALGERRANAVKRYLVDLGVPTSKFRTVSFGEDRPAVQGHDESAWRYNRRADFVQ
jgi:peptidoglycan-associated lipoprotein